MIHQEIIEANRNMKPTNFKQLALLVIMAVMAIILGLVCIYLEKDEQRHEEGLKTIILNKTK